MNEEECFESMQEKADHEQMIDKLPVCLKIVKNRGYGCKSADMKFCYMFHENRCKRAFSPLCSGGRMFKQITRTEFNFTTGKKYRVTKSGRVFPYEE